MTLSRDFYLGLRQALLLLVDLLERELGILPRTAQMRKALDKRLQPERSAEE